MEEEDSGSGAPDWIVTFSDMVSLLVTFFILLLTFSSMDNDDVFQVPKNILGTRGVIEHKNGHSIEAPEVDLMQDIQVNTRAYAPHSRPQGEFGDDPDVAGQKKTPDHQEVDLSKARDGLVMHFDERASFAPGSATISPYLEQTMAELGRVVEHYRFLVVVEGFTDQEFSPTPQYPTAEALGCARATAAAKAMLAGSNIRPELVQVAGIGAKRPLNGNSSARERSQNRRVEVRLVSLEKGF